MMDILKPDLGKFVWAGLGFFLAPKLLRFIR